MKNFAKSTMIASVLLCSFAHSAVADTTETGPEKTILHISLGAGTPVTITVNGNVVPTDAKTPVLDSDISRYVTPGRNVVQLSWAHAARQIDLRVLRVVTPGTPQEIKKAHFGVHDDIGANTITCAFRIIDSDESHS